jgi:hypothetical protein
LEFLNGRKNNRRFIPPVHGDTGTGTFAALGRVEITQSLFIIFTLPTVYKKLSLFPVHIFFRRFILPNPQLSLPDMSVNMTGEPFAIYIFNPGCPDCCCNECGAEFSWDGTTRPACPSCNAKNIRSA